MFKKKRPYYSVGMASPSPEECKKLKENLNNKQEELIKKQIELVKNKEKYQQLEDEESTWKEIYDECLTDVDRKSKDCIKKANSYKEYKKQFDDNNCLVQFDDDCAENFFKLRELELDLNENCQKDKCKNVGDEFYNISIEKDQIPISSLENTIKALNEEITDLKEQFKNCPKQFKAEVKSKSLTEKCQSLNQRLKAVKFNYINASKKTIINKYGKDGIKFNVIQSKSLSNKKKKAKRVINTINEVKDKISESFKQTFNYYNDLANNSFNTYSSQLNEVRSKIKTLKKDSVANNQKVKNLEEKIDIFAQRKVKYCK